MAASAERRERELPAPRNRSTKTSLQGLPSHLRDWDSAAARLAPEGCSEIVRKADCGALHTCILASPETCPRSDIPDQYSGGNV